MEILKQRRTIRKYQQKDISSDLLNDLLDSAFRASTVGNMQVYSVIVTRDAERKAKLAPAHFNQPMVKTAPVVLTFCIDLRRFTKWCEQRKATPGYNNLEWFVTGSVDALLAAQTFCVAAEEKGLGICYLGTTTYNPQMIIEALELPELVFPITTVTVGWPAEEPAAPAVSSDCCCRCPRFLFSRLPLWSFRPRPLGLPIPELPHGLSRFPLRCCSRIVRVATAVLLE